MKRRRDIFLDFQTDVPFPVGVLSGVGLVLSENEVVSGVQEALSDLQHFVF